ncbi:MAG: efflux RND transporter periplasmic adaptor subunit, partial [Myxococcota bacterium]
FVNAQIRAQVTGYLLKQHYREGSLVRAGDLLFEIDPRQFRAALARARGQLGEAEAMLGKSVLDVERYTPLAAEGAVSRQELDDANQAKLRNEASVAKARAEVQQARLDLSWTRILSPIGGIAGIAVAQVGDLVSPTTELTTVSQVDPIKVAFPISEQEYLRLFRNFSDEERERSEGKKDALELILADGSTYEHRGTATIVGREVDPRTGTIRIEGYFPNPRNLLRPGQFAKVRTVLRTAEDALLVPQRAVRDMQGRAQVAVVGSDDTVEIRGVELGARSGSLWIIAKGLEPGERVIVEGVQKVRSGITVAVQRPSSDSSPQVSAAPKATN